MLLCGPGSQPLMQASQLVATGACSRRAAGTKREGRRACHTCACIALRARINEYDVFPRALARTAADHYGPAEVLIGRFLASHPEQRANTQVGTRASQLRRHSCGWLQRWAHTSTARHRARTPAGLHASWVPGPVLAPAAAALQVFSKYCVFGRRDMSGISKAAVKEVGLGASVSI